MPNQTFLDYFLPKGVEASQNDQQKLFASAFASAVLSITAGLEDPTVLATQLRVRSAQLADIADLIEAAMCKDEEEKPGEKPEEKPEDKPAEKPKE